MKTISAIFQTEDAAELAARKIKRTFDAVEYSIKPTHRNNSSHLHTGRTQGAAGFFGQMADREAQIGILQAPPPISSSFIEYCPQVELLLNTNDFCCDNVVSVLINSLGENISVLPH